MASNPLAKQIAPVLNNVPPPLRTILSEVVAAKEMRYGIKEMMTRSAEMADPLRAILAGTLMHQPSRDHLDRALDRAWAQNRLMAEPDLVPELVIGSGVHAAIYCATRAAKARREKKPFVRPLVLEAERRVGGVFAMTHKPSFYLNSRNRAGMQGVPGEGGALNLLPNAPLQPFDITNTEYQTNTSMADVVRVTLAMYAQVIPRALVQSISSIYTYGTLPRYKQAVYVGRKTARADTVIVAIGLGRPYSPFPGIDISKEPRVLSYPRFLARLDQPFPLRGMRRVAVIGAGDSAKTVLESLVGLGPPAGMSSPSLDQLERIDWYGIGQNMTELDFCAGSRTRYRRLGRFLRPDNNQQRVIRPRQPAGRIRTGDELVFVDGVPYDHVIVTTGFKQVPVTSGKVNPWPVGGRVVGNRGGQYGTFYVVGPAAALPLDDDEITQQAFAIPENSTAIFRYAPRTAALAASL